MNSGTITVNVSDELTYDIIHESEQNLWGLLLMTGHLTKDDQDATGDTVVLRIPNKEIAGIFQDTVAVHFRETLNLTSQKALMEAMWEGDTETASKTTSDLLRKTISYNDYHEDYYHAFLAGIFVGRGYETESNKEKGLGRPDIQLFDQENDRAMILEVKRSASADQMEKDCELALEQIVRNEYSTGLQEEFREVQCYGISFFQKSALIKKLQTSMALRQTPVLWTGVFL